MHTVRLNKAKPEQLILSKIYLIKMDINSRLLDMQGYKELFDSEEASILTFNILL
jgi:hypothetical protein